MLLSEAERMAAAKDVREMILSSGQTAQWRRAVEAERLYGSDPEETELVATIPIEFDADPPEELAQEIDARASILPEADVKAEDQLVIDGETFRVQSVGLIQLFGVTTHKTLMLVKLHGR